MKEPMIPGAKLGRFEIRSKIGAGGMDAVYLAHDTKLDRQVASKILPPELAANHDRMWRFVQEPKQRQRSIIQTLSTPPKGAGRLLPSTQRAWLGWSN